MSIEAINEQLLRAIGIGVALVDLSDLSLRYRNDSFQEWFGEASGGSLEEIFPSLDVAAMKAALSDGNKFAAEISFKLRRRKMSVAIEFNQVLDRGAEIAVLICQNITRIKELESMIDSYSMMVERNTLEIKREKEQVEKLLLNMMPRAVYEEFKTFGVVSPKVYQPVSVLSLEFEGFEVLQDGQDAAVVVSELNDIFNAFDRIGEQFGCLRVRTNGDTYVAVVGVPDPVQAQGEAVANAAVRFQRYLSQRSATHPIKWNAKIGLATGKVIGSVVGAQNYIYDIFGPVVGQAARLRSQCSSGEIAADAETAGGLGSGFSVVQGAADPLINLVRLSTGSSDTTPG